MTLRHKAFALAFLASSLLLPACSGLRAKAAFQDANKLYKEEKYKEAILLYQKAVDLDSGMAEAWFYLANSNQALYRPGKPAPENRARLDNALQQYLESLKVNESRGGRLGQVRANTLVALVQIYSEEPYKNYDEAVKYAEELVKDKPDDIRNLFAFANLMEKFDKYPEAEKAYVKAFDLNPQDVKACSGLAGFYNKPYWEGRARFDDAIATLAKCAALAPEDPVGYYKISTFYWDKAYRDPLISDAQKLAYAEKGLEAADKALSLQPDYCDALIYKNLLLRVKAGLAANPRQRALLLDEADAIRKLAIECKKQAAETSAAPSPAETAQ
jgi:tetratricopeptide (TPR) repeat protein